MRSAQVLEFSMLGEPILHHPMRSILNNTSVLLENEVGMRLHTEIGLALN